MCKGQSTLLNNAVPHLLYNSMPRPLQVEYKTEEDLARLERTLHREPNQEILEHQWKRGIEVKCLELQEDLEQQG